MAGGKGKRKWSPGVKANAGTWGEEKSGKRKGGNGIFTKGFLPSKAARKDTERGQTKESS